MATSALYACTKCNQRYPFEELSQGQQLCKVWDVVCLRVCVCARALICKNNHLDTVYVLFSDVLYVMVNYCPIYLHYSTISRTVAKL